MQAFRRAAEEINIKLEIWGADITTTAPALLFCDKSIQVPRIKDLEYIPALLEVCKREKIDALIPTIDTDLMLLAENRETFLSIGTKVIISAPEKIKICRDKRLIAQYFHSIGLYSPKPVDDYLSYTDGFPAFIKPKDGSSSLFAYKVNDISELESYAKQVPDYIIQPYIEGVEYTVDVFCDFEGNPIYITPRERVSVRSGEVLKTKILYDKTIIEEVLQLVENYRPCGAITVQLIQQAESGKNYYIEINPRFGGGAPLSMRAGANSAKALLQLLCGEKLSYQPYVANEESVFSRFDQSIRIGGSIQNLKAIIFDLDDTLYSEKDYVYSGLKAVSEHFADCMDFYEESCRAFKNGLPIFDTVLSNLGILNQDNKMKCLQIYREHFPKITLYNGVKELIQEIRERGMKVGILTDGRPNGQRNKISALGLQEFVDEIIVTDEIGGEQFRKPNDIAFRIMQRKMGIPFENMVYVGDNVNKDFIAPQQLGMRTILFKNPNGLYPSNACNNTDYIIEDEIIKLKEVIFK